MYCPNCDMEFVDGVTVCSDCGGALVEKETWLAEQERLKALAEEEKERIKEEYLKSREEIGVVAEEPEEIAEERENLVYKNESEKYDENKSSAMAFLILGIGFSVFAVLLWVKVFSLGTVMKIFVTVIAAACLAVAVLTIRRTGEIKKRISEETEKRKQITDSFIKNYPVEVIDASFDYAGLMEEEKVLKRYEFIQDRLMTDNDITDKALAADITEELYNKIFEEKEDE